MKRKSLFLIIFTCFFCTIVSGQSSAAYSKIDLMLLRGDYNKVIDTCKLVLGTDSTNSDIYYKMGLAYQNLLPDDKSFDCFTRALTLAPDNNLYKYMVAKGYYAKGRNRQAKPLFQSLCALDSLNWSYAYYLTSIYMQEGKYDESIHIYNKFHNRDSLNYVFIDKIGFALLRKGDLPNAIDMFNRSLAINNKNINAIKNVAHLYSYSYRIDTAIQLLTRGIEIDPNDIDLYVRRAALYYSIDYNKRALNDYLKILSSGDSSFLYLKRAGIGYTNNMQPKEAIVYLLKASRKDTTDYETLDFIARNYHKLNDLKKSADYYTRIIEILTPLSGQLGIAHFMLAEELKSDGRYKEAIETYLKGQKLRSDINIYMIIANIYDEKLLNIPKAIYYYQLFVDNLSSARMNFSSEYVDAVKKRLDFLKEKQKSPQK